MVAIYIFLPFPSEKWDVWKKGKNSNIYGTMPPIVFFLSPCVWENNRILNKNYWDDLDKVIIIVTFHNFTEF